MASPTRIARGSLGIRSSLLRTLVLLVLFMAAAVLAVTTLSANQSANDLSRTALVQTTERVRAELDGFFDPVVAQLLAARDWGRRGAFDVTDPAAMNARFIPVLLRHPQVTSMMVANTRGEAYMLLREGNQWRTRLTQADARPGMVTWWRWTTAGELLETYDEALDYDPRTRPWFEGAIAGDGEVPHWTEPYTFFTTKDPGITASIRWDDPEDEGLGWVVGFDVMLIDVSTFTTSARVGETGYAVVLTEDGGVMGLPHSPQYSDREGFKAFVLKPLDHLGVAPLTDARNDPRSDRPRPFALRTAGGPWWASFTPYTLGRDRAFQIGVMVPVADFRGLANRQRNVIIGLTLLFLLLAVLSAFVLDKAVQLSMRKAIDEARKLGQYTLEGKIGEGGMGAVYRARHAMLRRPTAVKLLKAEQDGDRKALERFEREVQMTSQLTHPNTIAIYDYGRTPDDVFYYAMEYLDGITLDALIKQTGPLPPGRVIHVLRQACGSLREAHDVGLVHRDIKPENLMLCERGGIADLVKVLDFGLVTDVQAEDEDHEVIGTPLYMAPEAIETPNEVDPRTDIYALGAVGYFLLTGHNVFEGDRVEVVLTQHLYKDPPRPSTRVDFDVPSDLEDVLLACLEKEPGDRIQTAADLRARLGRCKAAKSWGPKAAARWWEAHRQEVAAPAVAALRSSEAKDFTVNLQSRGG